jgi:hypothetical protein
VAPAPRVDPTAPEDQQLHAYYTWLVTTLPQERLYAAVAIVGFLCLAGVAMSVRDLLGHDRALVRAGAAAIGLGSVLWIAATIFQLGGHHAIGLMATHTNPIETVASIAFTVDTAYAALALASFALIGLGMLAVATAAAQTWPGHRGWVAATTLVGLLMLVIAWSYIADNDNVTDLTLVAGGVVALPLWLLWTDRIRRGARVLAVE